jgi:catechol 2,3-dioxygenase-like lactoylglutathione lyase family enzyme
VVAGVRGYGRAHRDEEVRVAERGGLHHLELYVSDLERSHVFWGWLLSELGYEPHQEWDEGCSYRRGPTYVALVEAPSGARPLDRRDAGLNHVAFHAGDRADVDRLTRAVAERGGRVLYEDRHPYAGGADHYALFCEDPDGLKVELVAADGEGAGSHHR